jgi:hypothetical protein
LKNEILEKEIQIDQKLGIVVQIIEFFEVIHLGGSLLDTATDNIENLESVLILFFYLNDFLDKEERLHKPKLLLCRSNEFMLSIRAKKPNLVPAKMALQIALNGEQLGLTPDQVTKVLGLIEKSNFLPIPA